MNVLIIEDEIPARAKLEIMLRSLQPEINIVGQFGSVKDSICWLQTHEPPDLAFVDIQLSDNHSFEIFKQYPVKFPVVFTTAYDKYLLESFEFNSIDYLLKPITEEKLKRSLAKVKKLEEHFLQGNLLKLIHQTENKFILQRIVVKKGTDFIALSTDDVAFFFTEHKVVFVKDFQGRQFITDQTLAELEESMDRKKFFRINRKFLVNLKAIDRFKPDNGKILIALKPEMKEEIHISKETAPDFRTWISG